MKTDFAAATRWHYRLGIWALCVWCGTNPAWSEEIWEWDAEEFLLELESRTVQLSAPSAQASDAWKWTEAVLYADDFVLWEAHRSAAESLLATEAPEGVPPHRAVAWLYQPWRMEWEERGIAQHFPNWSADSLAWTFVRRQMLAHWSRARSLSYRSHAPDELVQPMPVGRGDAFGLWLAVALLLLAGNIAFFWHNRKAFRSADVPAHHPLVSSLEESIEHQRQTSTTLLQISALEFELTGSQFKEKLKDPDAWDRLARKQQLLLYLVLKGYSMEECAEYFGVSKGHIYNKRWEFRRLFDLDEAADFTTLLK